MKHYLLISLLSFSVAVAANYSFIGKCYVQTDTYTEWTCYFQNDSICIFTHIFKCDDLKDEDRIHKFICKYSLKEDDDMYIIVVNNIDTLYNDIFYIDLPYITSKSCIIFDSLSRVEPKSIPPRKSQYEKYGRIISINSGTLYMSKKRKNILVFYKKISDTEGQGIVFKRKRYCLDLTPKYN